MVRRCGSLIYAVQILLCYANCSAVWPKSGCCSSLVVAARVKSSTQDATLRIWAPCELVRPWPDWLDWALFMNATNSGLMISVPSHDVHSACYNTSIFLVVCSLYKWEDYPFMCHPSLHSYEWLFTSWHGTRWSNFFQWYTSGIIGCLERKLKWLLG